MNKLEQLRKKLADIVANLAKFDAIENFSAEQVEEVNGLSEEFASVQAQIETQEKIEAMATTASTSTRKTSPVQPVAKVEVGVNRRTLDPKGGFSTRGEYFRAVAKAGSNGEVDDRLRILAGAQEKIGEDGGFLIPTDFRQDIQKAVNGDESLLPRTRQFQTSSNNLSLPVNETAPWDGTGIQAYWEGEASTLTASKSKFGEMAMRLHKLTALVRVTDELLEDASAIESHIRAEAPAAMMHKINSAIISGSGAGQPHGFLNSPFAYTVNDLGAGQPADSLVFANINSMLGRILPQSMSKAVWLINPGLLEKLRAMSFDPGSSTLIPVYLPSGGVSGAPYGTLYGRPILPMMGGVKPMGDVGDISLVDLSYYYTAVKTAGITSDISTHVYFTSGESAFKFVMRIAGQCPFKAPITNEANDYQMSGFVLLDNRTGA